MAPTTKRGDPLAATADSGLGALVTSPSSPGRRNFFRFGMGLAALMCLSGCDRPKTLLRVGTNTFPGYEFMHVASQLGYFDQRSIRVIRFPAATQVLHAVSSGQLEVVALTLDELLAARAAGLPLRAIAVLDISLGADMVFARPGLTTRDDFLGKVFYAEKTGVGAVMLDAFLDHLQIAPKEVNLRFALGEELVEAYAAGLADAVVVFSPAHIPLEAAGAKLVFDSRSIPGRIVDILAVTETALSTHSEALGELLRGHFTALKAYQANEAQVRQLLARGLSLPPDRLDEALTSLHLPGIQENQDWLSGSKPKLLEAAKTLANIMIDSGLLARTGVEAEVLDLIDARSPLPFPPTE